MRQRILTRNSNVLVTGATGLIGGEIVRRLHTISAGKIWALVRPKANADAPTRFLERMARSGESIGSDINTHVEALPGEITAPMWNLAADDLDVVTSSVDVIIHCAADTSFLGDKSVQSTNVAGVSNLIELAGRCLRKPLIVYMSTATNSGKMTHRSLTEDEGCRPDNDHHNEYTRSKAVAEQMLRASGLPVLTLRPTIVLSAGIPDRDFAQQILWFVPLLKKLSCLPVDPASRVDVVPIDYVVEASLRLLQTPHRRFDCYHLSAGARHATMLAEANEFVASYYRRRASLKLIHPMAWTETHERAHFTTPLQRKVLLSMGYYLPFLNMDVVYDNTRLTRELGAAMPSISPLVTYLGSLLDLITHTRALQEAARP